MHVGVSRGSAPGHAGSRGGTWGPRRRKKKSSAWTPKPRGRPLDEFDKAVKRALQGEAKVKYFQHAGCLLTADGSDDELIKFEGAPAGYKLKIP